MALVSVPPQLKMLIVAIMVQTQVGLVLADVAPHRSMPSFSRSPRSDADDDRFARRGMEVNGLHLSDFVCLAGVVMTALAFCRQTGHPPAESQKARMSDVLAELGFPKERDDGVDGPALAKRDLAEFVALAKEERDGALRAAAQSSGTSDGMAAVKVFLWSALRCAGRAAVSICAWRPDDEVDPVSSIDLIDKIDQLRAQKDEADAIPSHFLWNL